MFLDLLNETRLVPRVMYFVFVLREGVSKTDGIPWELGSIEAENNVFNETRSPQMTVTKGQLS